MARAGPPVAEAEGFEPTAKRGSSAPSCITVLPRLPNRHSLSGKGLNLRPPPYQSGASTAELPDTGTRAGFEPPRPRTTALQAASTNRIRLTRLALELPEQDSNLQSRINNPLVYRLTDRGTRHRHRRADIPAVPARLRVIQTSSGNRRNRNVSRSMGS